MADDCTTSSHYLTYTTLKIGRMYLVFGLGSRRVKQKTCLLSFLSEPDAGSDSPAGVLQPRAALRHSEPVRWPTPRGARCVGRLSTWIGVGRLSAWIGSRSTVGRLSAGMNRLSVDGRQMPRVMHRPTVGMRRSTNASGDASANRRNGTVDRCLEWCVSQPSKQDGRPQPRVMRRSTVGMGRSTATSGDASARYRNGTVSWGLGWCVGQPSEWDGRPMPQMTGRPAIGSIDRLLQPAHRILRLLHKSLLKCG